jgi:hypothetical protein
VAGTNVCTKCSPLKICGAYTLGIDAYPEHMCKELKRLLKVNKIENFFGFDFEICTFS